MTTNRIDLVFSRLRAAGRKGFITYLAAGDPDLPRTGELVRAVARAGSDVVELGVPFSDPLADGVVNQLAAMRGLASGTTVRGVLELVRGLRAAGEEVPIVLYTYLNPVYAFGFARFLAEAAAAGVDGILPLDLPPDEQARNGELARASAEAGVRFIRLLAPTTPPERVRAIAAGGEGFLYYVSREGVTGEQSEVSTSLGERLALIRGATDLPVAVGFGISTPAQAAEAARAGADAVVVGSAIVRRVGEWGAEPNLAARVEEFVRPMVEAVRQVEA